MGPIVVLKVGTSSLVDAASQKIRILSIARVAETTAKLYEAGYQVVIVTSGAVGLGCARLGLKERPTTLAGKQAAAAVGQLKLLSLYDDIFSSLGLTIAQVLLTYDAFGSREQYMNARGTLNALLSQNCVPIVNENDTVAVQELRVGDNDTLSALVANMVGARWLFLLTDVDSLYTSNPRVDPTAQALRVIRTSEQVHNLRKQMAAGLPRLNPDLSVDDALAALSVPSPPSPSHTSNTGTSTTATGASSGRRSKSPSTGSSLVAAAAAGSSPAAASSPAVNGAAGSAFGTGGMSTKLRAALLGTAAGVTVVIMNSEGIDAVHALLGAVAMESAGMARSGIASGLVHELAQHVVPVHPEHSVLDGARLASTNPRSNMCFADKGVGTTFLPAPSPVTGRKRWILSLTPQGVLMLDSGAVSAVVEQRKSLYAAGVKEVQGDFGAMDAVTLIDEQGRVLAHALCNYNLEDVGKLKGRHSRDFPDVLGYVGREAMCDRDNIVLL